MRVRVVITAVTCGLAASLALAPQSMFGPRRALPGVAFADTTAVARADTFLAYDEPPRAIKIFAPEYPSEARRARIEGTVDVRMTISEHGRVIEAAVHRSDTIPILEEAALKAAKISLFRPALSGGRPVRARLVFAFPFKAAQ